MNETLTLESQIVGQDRPISFELLALANAKNYQQWVYETISPWLGGRILEVGSGIGNMSRWLPARERLLLTETDEYLFEILKKEVESEGFRLKNQSPRQQNISVLALDVTKSDLKVLDSENLDTIVSFNVLEHIEDDQKALRELIGVLQRSQKAGPKRLISFVPAHDWAYGAADEAFGHHRRYCRGDLKRKIQKISPNAKIHFQYFNFFGLWGWVFSGRLMKRSKLGVGAIKIFEFLCPVLIPIDRFLLKTLKLPLGQSLLCVVEL